MVLYIGVFARRQSAHGAEDYFLAGRSLGQFVFLFSLFGTNMTAFTILGSSGHAFNNGIVTFPLMGSSSAIVIPLCLYLFGTRLWSLGKRYGFITMVQLFRDRWECGHIGTAIFLVQALLLVPYIIIGVMGGGTTLATISGGFIPYWLGGGVVAMVVMVYVFFGGMRGTARVNTFQTLLFLTFGVAAIVVIGRGMSGFTPAMESLLASPDTAHLLTRERVSPWYYFSYALIPLSAIAFPHIGIFCLTAKRVEQFKKTVVFYPLCILAIWMPCVYLGVAANRATDIPKIREKQEARATLAREGATLSAEERGKLRARMAADDVVILLLHHYAPIWLAGMLGAGIMAAVMASDSQILALSTMFTEDVFAFYGHTERFGEEVEVHTGRLFVILLTIAAYVIALKAPQPIFDIAIQYAFSGFVCLAVLLPSALFWRGSTKWGALAVTLWTALAIAAVAVFQSTVPAPVGRPVVVWTLGGVDVLTRTPGGTAVFGFLPVAPMLLVAGLLMWVVSSLTRKPSASTLARYFRTA